jgi:hypothetical protein
VTHFGTKYGVFTDVADTCSVNNTNDGVHQ